MRTTPTRVVAVASAVLVLAAACGGADGDRGGGDPRTELRLAIGGEPDDGYDPTRGWGRYGSPLFQSTLLTRDADLELVGDLATDHVVSEDGLVWTVTIRDDVTFTDGEPLTAHDVAYTFTTAAEAAGLTDVTVLESATAVDDRTVELRLERPQSTFVHRLATLGIVPRHLHDDDYARNPVGSGPYSLVRWDEGQQLIVERNDGYHGDAPAFERLVFVFTGEDASLAAGRAGQVDVVAVPSTLATGDVAGMELVAVPSVDNRGLVFPYPPATGATTDDGHPIGNDVTSDVAVRRAVNLAVDRDALVEGVLEGHGSPASGPVDAMAWYEPDSAVAGGDLAGAEAILDAAGWTSDGSGTRERDGVRAAFSLVYPADDTLRQGLALAVADQLDAIGIDVDAQGRSWDEIEGLMHSQAVLFGWGSHDPTEMYNLHHSAQGGVEYWNPGFYANPRVDAHLDAAMAATDEDEAVEHWRRAQLDEDGHGFSAGADAAWAWLVNLDHTYYVHECLDLGDLQVEPHGHGWPITAGISAWRWTC